ncbi:hypothetical protein BGZ47_007840 [Haplosporangium gracile]|nr:hypothetical protein BGZ47_007840 [Haplosporangium gracile]
MPNPRVILLSLTLVLATMSTFSPVQAAAIANPSNLPTGFSLTPSASKSTTATTTQNRNYPPHVKRTKPESTTLKTTDSPNRLVSLFANATGPPTPGTNHTTTTANMSKTTNTSLLTPTPPSRTTSGTTIELVTVTTINKPTSTCKQTSSWDGEYGDDEGEDGIYDEECVEDDGDDGDDGDNEDDGEDGDENDDEDHDDEDHEEGHSDDEDDGGDDEEDNDEDDEDEEDEADDEDDDDHDGEEDEEVEEDEEDEDDDEETIPEEEEVPEEVVEEIPEEEIPEEEIPKEEIPEEQCEDSDEGCNGGSGKGDETIDKEKCRKLCKPTANPARDACVQGGRINNLMDSCSVKIYNCLHPEDALVILDMNKCPNPDKD